MPYYRLPYALVQWAVFAALKFALLLIGIPAVFLSVLGDGAQRTPAMWKYWADAESTPVENANVFPSWMPNSRRLRVFWYNAIRNPVRGLEAKRVANYNQKGSIDESKPGVQWRYRWSGWMDSFRIVWGDPRPSKGKREFYVGWKIGSPSPNKFTVQFRPF